jgi:hypothetical protein
MSGNYSGLRLSVVWIRLTTAGTEYTEITQSLNSLRILCALCACGGESSPCYTQLQIGINQQRVPGLAFIRYSIRILDSVFYQQERDK